VLASSSSTCACHEDGKKQHGFHAEKLHQGHRGRKGKTRVIAVEWSATRDSVLLPVADKSRFHPEPRRERVLVS
jgi:hypothetical protein